MSAKRLDVNPVTPIVIMFQRAIYGKLDNTTTGSRSCRTGPSAGYCAYLGWSFVFGFVMLVLAIKVFGRSEANFAEEL